MVVMLLAVFALNRASGGRGEATTRSNGEIVVASSAGTYEVAVAPDPADAPTNELHTWTLTVRDDRGRPVEDAEISVDGDMPAHGHGLPTSPAVEPASADGVYRVKGMKFQMAGDWFVEFTIRSSVGEDRARFDFTLE